MLENPSVYLNYNNSVKMSVSKFLNSCKRLIATWVSCLTRIWANGSCVAWAHGSSPLLGSLLPRQLRVAVLLLLLLPDYQMSYFILLFFLWRCCWPSGTNHQQNSTLAVGHLVCLVTVSLRFVLLMGSAFVITGILSVLQRDPAVFVAGQV